MTGWKICFLKSELHKHDEYEQTFSYRNEATFPTIIELKYAVGNLKILAKRNKWSRASFMQIIAVSCWSVNRITFETFKNVININLGAKNKTCSMNWEVLICFVASAQCCLFRSTQIECSVGNNNVCFVWMGLFCWSSHIKIRRFQDPGASACRSADCSTPVEKYSFEFFTVARTIKNDFIVSYWETRNTQTHTHIANTSGKKTKHLHFHWNGKNVEKILTIEWNEK